MTPQDMLANLYFTNSYWLFAAIPPILILLYILTRGEEGVKKILQKKSITYLAMRTIIIILICLALAGPYLLSTHKTISEIPPITIIVDDSASMNQYQDFEAQTQRLHQNLQEWSKNLTGTDNKIRLENLGTTNQTALGDRLYQATLATGDQNSVIVLATDGNNNQGRDPLQVAKILGRSNITVNTLTPNNPQTEVYLSALTGDSKIPANSQYILIIRAEKTNQENAKYNLQIYVDDMKRYGKTITQQDEIQEMPFTLNFRGPGIHTIKVVLQPLEKDKSPDNNILYKSVKVVDRPPILIVSQQDHSPLLSVASELYNITLTTNLADQNLEEYTAIVLDDLPASDIPASEIARLRDYTLEGNGLLVVGGPKSFEYGSYNNSMLETLLPVRAIEKPSEKRKHITALFLVDTSLSSRSLQSGDQKIDIEKALAIKMLRGLKESDSVGVIVFNVAPYIVSELSPLGPKLTGLEDKLLRLQATSGGTKLQPAISMGKKLLQYEPGKKFLIIISDGNIQRTRMPGMKETLQDLGSHNTKTYTVGVGYDTREDVLQELADAGGGLFFRPDAYQRLSLEFGRTIDKEYYGEYFPLLAHQEYHYIIRSLDLTQAEIKEYNRVTDKAIASPIITTVGNHPLLTVWNLGLGRVAALSTDNGQEWAPQLYEFNDGRLFSRITNWVIGDLEKTKQIRVDVNDQSYPEKVTMNIRSEKAVDLTIRDEKTRKLIPSSLKQTSLNTYQGSFTPPAPSIYEIKVSQELQKELDLVAVNYPQEYASLHTQEEYLAEIAQTTGGRQYNQNDIGALMADITNQTTQSSLEQTFTKTQLWPYAIATAFILYFLDAALYRIREILRLRKRR